MLIGNYMRKFKTFIKPFVYHVTEFFGILINKLTISKTHFDVAILKNEYIGDGILALDALETIKQFLQSKKVCMIANASLCQILQSDKSYSKIIPINPIKYTKSPSYILKTIWKFRKLKFDTVYVFDTSRWEVTDALVKIISAKEKIGFHETLPNGDIKLSPYLKNYIRLVNYPPQTFMPLRYVYFFNDIFNFEYKAKLPQICKIVEFKKVNEPNAPYITIFIGSSMEKRIWSIERFAALIKMLPKQYSYIITGHGDYENQLAEQLIKSTAETKQTIVNTVGQFSIPELCAVIQNSLFTIGNDSMGCHLSSALGIHTFCVSGGGQWNNSIPYTEYLLKDWNYHHIIYKEMPCFNCIWHCIYPLEDGMTKCVADIYPEDVINKVNEFIKN